MTFKFDNIKFQRGFQNNSLIDSQINQLKKNHPFFMEEILSLEPLKIKENLTWSYIKSKNGYYVGEINKDKIRNGRGAYAWDIGVIYIGYWINNISEIRGKVFKGQEINYKGEFKNGKKHGKGIYYFNTGDRYEGDFKDDKREGKGSYFWKDGSKWEGSFLDSKLHGIGKYYPESGKPFDCQYANGVLLS
jgi:hypothetical protein